MKNELSPVQHPERFSFENGFWNYYIPPEPRWMNWREARALGLPVAQHLLDSKPLNKEYMSKTLGEKRVRSGFNPSENPRVKEFKAKAAELIDFVNMLPEPLGLDNQEKGEWYRCKAEAMTNIETGAMYAVKAITYTPGE